MANRRSWRVLGNPRSLRKNYQQIFAQLLLGGQERAVLHNQQIWRQ